MKLEKLTEMMPNAENTLVECYVCAGTMMSHSAMTDGEVLYCQHCASVEESIAKENI